jgi:flap endonuclease-1
MDTLTFSAPILYRHLTFSEAKKQPISEINLEKALEGLDMNMSQVRIHFFLATMSVDG